MKHDPYEFNFGVKFNHKNDAVKFVAMLTALGYSALVTVTNKDVISQARNVYTDCDDIVWMNAWLRRHLIHGEAIPVPPRIH